MKISFLSFAAAAIALQSPSVDGFLNLPFITINQANPAVTGYAEAQENALLKIHLDIGQVEKVRGKPVVTGNRMGIDGLLVELHGNEEANYEQWVWNFATMTNQFWLQIILFARLTLFARGILIAPNYQAPTVPTPSYLRAPKVWNFSKRANSLTIQDLVSRAWSMVSLKWFGARMQRQEHWSVALTYLQISPEMMPQFPKVVCMWWVVSLPFTLWRIDPYSYVNYFIHCCNSSNLCFIWSQIFRHSPSLDTGDPDRLTWAQNGGRRKGSRSHGPPQRCID